MNDSWAKWVGRAVYVRTLGEAWVGRLAEVTPMELILEEASWVADIGRVSRSVNEGLYRSTDSSSDSRRDIERFPQPVVIGRGHIVSGTLFAGPDGVDHRLPSESGPIG